MSIKDYLIKEIQNIEEFRAIADAIDPEIIDLKKETTNLIDDQFIETATEKGIIRREKILAIQPYGDDTLNTRRFRVGAKWDNKLPYTYSRLIARFNGLVGDDGYTMNLVHGDYTLDIKINLGVKRMMQEANIMVRNMAPSNLIITVGLQYNRHIDLASFTHEYLATKTHMQLREEVLE